MSKSADQEDEEFKIVVEGKSLHCRKRLLREKSEYFRAMFDSSMIENQDNVVTLQDQEYSVVSCLIEFIKTGELKMKRGARNMKKLTEAAVIFQVEDAIESCTAYWKQTINNETCWSLMTYSKSLNLEQLYSCAKSFVSSLLSSFLLVDMFLVKNHAQISVSLMKSQKHFNRFLILKMYTHKWDKRWDIRSL